MKRTVGEAAVGKSAPQHRGGRGDGAFSAPVQARTRRSALLRPALALLLLGFCTLPLAAFRSYGPSDQEVTDLEALYYRAGYAFPTAGYPVETKELVDYARHLRRKTDSAEIRAHIDEYVEGLDYRPDEDSITSDLRFDYLQYIRGGQADYVEGYDFSRVYIHDPPMGSWALGAGNDGGLGVFVSAEARRAYYDGSFPQSTHIFFVEGQALALENTFLTKGYFSARAGGFYLLFGRSPVHSGASRFNAFLPSDRIPYLDMVYYTWRMGPLKMVSYFSMLDNYPGEGEMEALDAVDEESGGPMNFNVDPASDPYEIRPAGGVTDFTKFSDHSVSFGETIILDAMHRFEYSFPKLRLAVTAQQIVAREKNSIYIADVFPVFSWHNGWVGPHNLSLVLDGSYAPGGGVELYAQAGYDDVNAGDLLGVGDTEIPTISAYLLGAAVDRPTRGGDRWKAKLEGGTTHFLWGNFHEYDIERGNYLARAIYRYERDEEYVLLPLTSPYGPGARWLTLQGAFRWKEGFGLTGEARLVRKNVDASLVTTSYDNFGAAKEGEMQNRWYAEVSAYKRFPYGITLFFRPAYVIRSGAAWPEITLGGSVEFSHRAAVEWE